MKKHSRTLTIHYHYNPRPEVLKNIKTVDRAMEIVRNRGNVQYAEHNGTVIIGAKPKKPKHFSEMSLEEMEAQIIKGQNTGRLI